MPKPKKKTFVQSLERLEEISRAIEDTKTSLEDSLTLYKEAGELFVFCNASLNAAETEIMLIRKTASGEIIEEPFEEV
jgi:exodeoxyribonuclease VII small subunit